MKKKFLLLCFLFPAVDAGATEKILNFADVQNRALQEQIEKLRLPDEILKSLEDCTPTEKKTQTEIQGIEQNTSYSVRKDGESVCVLETISSSQNINVTFTCRFDEENRKVYLAAVKNLLEENNPTAESLMSNENYWIAAGIMSNEEICKGIRGEIDLTADIRAALKDCSPFTKTRSSGRMQEITYKIYGRENGVCRYEHIVTINLPESASKEMQSAGRQTIVQECLLNDSQRAELINILQKQIIPAGSATDFSIIGSVRDNSAEEAGFLSSNCELKI